MPTEQAQTEPKKESSMSRCSDNVKPYTCRLHTVKVFIVDFMSPHLSNKYDNALFFSISLSLDQLW